MLCFSTPQTLSFQKEINSYYEMHGRNLPWRHTKNPYFIFVSEVMLQQTQVERVIVKYGEFVSLYPDFSSLARADLKDVLSVWQGMGYNRRALSLVQAARTVMTEFGGQLPANVEALTTLSGIGKTTASSICAFAFDMPVVFIETNIRRVYLHHFFAGRENVSDREIMPLVEHTLDRAYPGKWYHALMDYGAMLKKVIPNPNTRSVHYRRQPPFHGSDRQVRGSILRLLLGGSFLSFTDMAEKLPVSPERLKKILDQLIKEKLVKAQGGESNGHIYSIC